MPLRTLTLKIPDEIALLFIKRYGWPDERNDGETAPQFFRRILKQHLLEAAKIQYKHDQAARFAVEISTYIEQFEISLEE